MKGSCKILIVALVAAALMAGCGDGGDDLDTDTLGAAPYRILSIGASFTEDAMRYLRDMLTANGAAPRDIYLVEAYIGGQTLAGHAQYAQKDWALYTRKLFGTGGDVSNTSDVKLKDMVASNHWDYIIFQQGADQAGNAAAYREEDIDYLLGFVKEHCPNPNVTIAFHMTWAYAANTSQPVFINTYGRDQMTHYNAIMGTVQDKILPRTGEGSDFAFIIPSGTAIQNARTVYGDTLNGDDGYHLNDFGRFIAGAMWLKKIYGKGIDVFTSPYQALNDYTITLDDMAKIQNCVDDAFVKPFEVTDE